MKVRDIDALVRASHKARRQLLQFIPVPGVSTYDLASHALATHEAWPIAEHRSRAHAAVRTIFCCTGAYNAN